MIQDGQEQLAKQLYGFYFLRAKLELSALEAAKVPNRPLIGRPVREPEFPQAEGQAGSGFWS